MFPVSSSMNAWVRVGGLRGCDCDRIVWTRAGAVGGLSGCDCDGVVREHVQVRWVVWVFQPGSWLSSTRLWLDPAVHLTYRVNPQSTCTPRSLPPPPRSSGTRSPSTPPTSTSPSARPVSHYLSTLCHVLSTEAVDRWYSPPSCTYCNSGVPIVHHTDQ